MIAVVNMDIAGQRLKFTPLQYSNIYKHFEWNNDPELNRLDSEMPFIEEAFGDFKKRFEEMLYHPHPNSLDFEIHLNDGTLIGVAYISDVSEHNRHCHASFTIGDRNFWGKGYGREAMDVILGYCFNELGMHLVMTDTFEYNQAWRRLVDWAGFEHQGTISDYLFRDGEYWSKEIYGMDEGRFAEMRSTLRQHQVHANGIER
ncbi:MAG: GNAT family N-acetyltransferase [Rhodothermales bacterium]|nr:GNAT family N-acetyltransferase [Rhodothermales bacterium]